MINKLNFTGKVFITPKTKEVSKDEEIEKIQEYADKKNIDIFVYDVTYYINGKGNYDTVIAKEGKIWQRNFDMQNEEKSTLKKIPGQEVMTDDIEGYLDGKYDLEVVDEDVLE